MRVYVPMTCNILTVGHIRLLKKLEHKGEVFIGLLSSKALEGYKKEKMPYSERLEILKSLPLHDKIVKQDSLDPYKNLKRYKCDALASGDGFEKCEIEAAEKLGIGLLEINSGSKRHSSDIK